MSLVGISEDKELNFTLYLILMNLKFSHPWTEQVEWKDSGDWSREDLHPGFTTRVLAV